MTPPALAVVAAALLAASASAQSAAVPPPPGLAGTWVGAFKVAFALADPTNPNSWECLPAGTPPISIPHSMAFSPDGTVSDSPWPNVTITASNGARYLWPGSSTFAFYDLLGLDASSNILSLAYPQDPYAGEDAICYYATITPSFPSSLTVTTIGGYAFSYVDQCAAASYKLPDNNNNVATPFCRRLNATSAIALATSVVGVYSLGAPSASPSGSPSASASSSPVFFTPSAPPSGISLSQGSPSASASASVAPAPGGNTGGGDGGGGSLGGSGGDAGGGTGGSVGGGPNTFPSPSAATKGPVVSSGAQGVASLASVAVAAFLGAAVAAAFQRRN